MSLLAQEGWVHFQLKDLHSARELLDTPEQIQKALQESGLGLGDEEEAISKSGTITHALALRPSPKETPGSQLGAQPGNARTGAVDETVKLDGNSKESRDVADVVVPAQNSTKSADSALPAKAAPVDSVAGEIETEFQNKSDTSLGEATKTAGAGDTDGACDGCSNFSQADIEQMLRQFDDSEVEPVASDPPPTAMSDTAAEVKQELDSSPCAAIGSTAVTETAETEVTEVPVEPVDPGQPVVEPDVPAEPSQSVGQSVVVEPENMNTMNTAVAGFLRRFGRTAVSLTACCMLQLALVVCARMAVYVAFACAFYFVSLQCRLSTCGLRVRLRFNVVQAKMLPAQQ